ncbi:MAG: hypothetical protein PHR87_01625 [Sulfurospirillaceae bacterium]|nr:hypothetical protein [Sulfurospirillaceae bacterium]
MLESVLSNKIFNQLMQKHVHEVISFLLKEGVNFSILTNIVDVKFDPILPSHISQNFKPITMFFLAGYTFDSTHIDEEVMSFEAGFGSDNFGSIVSVPMHAILQIIVEEIPIFINLSTPPKIEEKKPTEEGIKRSMDALMSNPENQKLLKR